jgi:tetratricopeptide (TPR) repeat protein
MMIQRPRIPAIATLLLVLTAGVFFLYGLRKTSGATDAQLAELQHAVAAPDATPATWMRYAGMLQELGQHSRAAIAYRRVLEADPYNRDARLNCALCLARMSNADECFNFLRATLLLDPRLTLHILGRPEVATFLAEGRFQTLKKDAVAQSLD